MTFERRVAQQSRALTGEAVKQEEVEKRKNT